MVGRLGPRLNARDGVVVDLEAWMHHPNDFDLPRIPRDPSSSSTAPRTDPDGARLNSMMTWSRPCCGSFGDAPCEFGVHGMHGRLDRINPIIADGKAKKLANANWKTVQPVHLE